MIAEQSRTLSSYSKKLWVSELFFWTVLVFFLNYLIAKTDLSSILNFLWSLNNFNLITFYAWFVIFYCLKNKENTKLATNFDINFSLIILFLTLIISAIGVNFLYGFLMFVFSVYYLIKYKNETHFYRSALILLAVSANTFWSPIIYHMALSELIHADAFILGNMLKVIRSDILWLGVGFQGPDGRTISLVGACSSFQNLSLATLAYVTMAIHFKGELDKRDLISMLWLCAAMILLNDIRLVLCVWSKEMYAYWHDGNGSLIYQHAANLTIFIGAYILALKRNKSKDEISSY